MHDALRRACQYICAQCACGWARCHHNNLVRRITVESNTKVSIIYTWLVKTLQNMLSSFALSLVLLPFWLLLYIDFVAFSFSVSPTVSCVQHSTPQNTYVVEDQLRCPPRTQLSRSVVPYPRQCSTDLRHQCTRRMSSWACMWVQITANWHWPEVPHSKPCANALGNYRHGVILFRVWACLRILSHSPYLKWPWLPCIISDICVQIALFVVL